MMTKLVGFGIARNLQQKSKWIKFVSECLNECFDNLIHKIPSIYLHTHSTFFHSFHCLSPTPHFFTNFTSFHPLHLLLPTPPPFTHPTSFHQPPLLLPIPPPFTHSTSFQSPHLSPTPPPFTHSTSFHIGSHTTSSLSIEAGFLLY